jgi:TRAP-type C4-dicarboxylate transport system substrate-binding protein
MFTNRLFYLFIVVALLMLTACTPQVAATPAVDKPITLRLAIADKEGRPSDPYVHEFITQVKTLSKGNITIKPLWDAGVTTEAGFEAGVIQLVKEGQADMGLAASRAFDNENINITSFQALQAPFLIDNDALAIAVAQSDVVRHMLENLASAGVVGLTLWPEDLRHPFSIPPNKPLLSPNDFAGLNVRVTPSGVSSMLIETLGGKPVSGDDNYQEAESGLRQGFSLTGTPIATGNVTFFAKFQVLVANGAAFEKFSEAQRTVLRQAAEATQKKAIAEHPSEGDAANAWCTDGGTIVLASDEQIAAFEKAAQPVFDWIAQNPLNAELITSIRELKAKTKPSPGAEACAPQVTQQNTTPSAGTEVWSQGLPPNGVWQAKLTTDDFVRMGLLRSAAQSDWAGVYTLTFKDGKYLMAWQGEQGQTGKCQANYEMVGDIVRLTYYQTTGNECEGGIEDFQWRLDNEGLHLHLVATNGKFVEAKAFFEAKTWQKVETWSAGLPPNGVWQVELTADDFIKTGTLKSTADDMAGIYTWTFQDGQAKIEIHGPRIKVSCSVVATVVGDALRLQNVASPDCDGSAYDDVQWRLDADGLHFHLISSQAVELKAMYEGKPWQKVAAQ